MAYCRNAQGHHTDDLYLSTTLQSTDPPTYIDISNRWQRVVCVLRAVKAALKIILCSLLLFFPILFALVTLHMCLHIREIQDYGNLTDQLSSLALAGRSNQCVHAQLDSG